MQIALVRTVDILQELGAARGDAGRPVLVDMPRETGDPGHAPGRSSRANRSTSSWPTIYSGRRVRRRHQCRRPHRRARRSRDAGAIEIGARVHRPRSGRAAAQRPRGAACALLKMPLRDDASQLSEHLRFFSELGVAGVSRDPGWRRRPADSSAVPETGEIQPLRVARSAAEVLQAIRVDVGDDCTRCKLHRHGRRSIVFGVGVRTPS